MSNFNFKKDKLDVEGFSFNAKNSGIVKEYRKQKGNMKEVKNIYEDGKLVGKRIIDHKAKTKTVISMPTNFEELMEASRLLMDPELKDELDKMLVAPAVEHSGIVKEYRKQKEHLKNLPKEIETPTMFEEITQMLLLPKKISETDTRIVFHCEVCQMATSVPKEVEVKEGGLKCPICFPSRKKKNEKPR